ncbi:MAG: hypothetical protein ABIE94_02770 [archaeon]
MAGIELVKDIDRFIPIRYVFVSTTDKSGLVDNLDKETEVMEGMPKEGIIGVLFDVNPDAVVISTGGTADHIARAGYKVMPISEFTGQPEMKSGLVKSMHPRLYAGMLAHPYTTSDAQYMEEQGIPSIDMALVNFYELGEKRKENPIEENPRAVEIIRQAIDVGGPTSTHTSAKGFLATAVATRPEDYALFAYDLIDPNHRGHIGLVARLQAAKHAAEDLETHFRERNIFMQQVRMEDLERCYTIHELGEGE